MLTDLRWSLKLLLSLTKDGVIPVYLWRILVRNLASWYVAVPHAETMGSNRTVSFIYFWQTIKLRCREELPVGSNLL